MQHHLAWDWVAVDWWQILSSAAPVLGVTVAAAIVGFGLGRLIRGRPYLGRHVSAPRS
ncbi:hypothetical protein [Paraburkholderia elongata]|uniref:Uncharacterized protein n=1 Tax=Paraburkholderia elongata TaxID=2675747 RepID=A0A972NUK8_9BURK|nr:hypothetical protein [Paraburkholderia elongata]NPT58112.1 hypothetical protein [Paraburkholderia elongata]